MVENKQQLIDTYKSLGLQVPDSLLEQQDSSVVNSEINVMDLIDPSTISTQEDSTNITNKNNTISVASQVGSREVINQEKKSLLEQIPGTFLDVVKSPIEGFLNGLAMFAKIGSLTGLSDDSNVQKLENAAKIFERKEPNAIDTLLAGGISSTVQSVTAGILGIIGGAIAGESVGPEGAVAGGVGGGVAGFALGAGTVFAFGEYYDYMRDLKNDILKKGGTEEDVKRIQRKFLGPALLSALAEGGGEALADYLGLKVVGLLGGEEVSAFAKESLRDFLGKLLKTYPIEFGTEFGQNEAEKALRRTAGIDVPENFAKDFTNTALVTLGQSLLFGATGSIDRNRKIKNATQKLSKILLDNEDVINDMAKGKDVIIDPEKEDEIFSAALILKEAKVPFSKNIENSLKRYSVRKAEQTKTLIDELAKNAEDLSNTKSQDYENLLFMMTQLRKYVALSQGLDINIIQDAISSLKEEPITTEDNIGNVSETPEDRLNKLLGIEPNAEQDLAKLEEERLLKQAESGLIGAQEPSPTQETNPSQEPDLTQEERKFVESLTKQEKSVASEKNKSTFSEKKKNTLFVQLTNGLFKPANEKQIKSGKNLFRFNPDLPGKRKFEKADERFIKKIQESLRESSKGEVVSKPSSESSSKTQQGKETKSVETIGEDRIPIALNNTEEELNKRIEKLNKEFKTEKNIDKKQQLAFELQKFNEALALKQGKFPDKRIQAKFDEQVKKELPKEFTAGLPEFEVNKKLKNKDGSKRLSSTDGKKIVINPVESVKEFFDYFTGKIGGITSEQKAKVLSKLAEQGYTLSRIKQILNSTKKVNSFLVLHEQNHIDNNDKDVYFSSGKNLLTKDKIDIETRATIDALKQIESKKIEAKNKEENKLIKKKSDIAKLPKNDPRRKLLSFLDKFGFEVNESESLIINLANKTIDLDKSDIIQVSKALAEPLSEMLSYSDFFFEIEKEVRNTKRFKTRLKELEKERPESTRRNLRRLATKEIFKELLEGGFSERLSNDLNVSKSLLQKIKEFVQKVIDSLKGADYSKIKPQIDTIVENTFKGDDFVRLTKKEGYELVDFQTAFDKNPLAKDIMTAIGTNPKIVLTGSIAYSTQGTVYRPIETVVHDLDFLNTGFSRDEIDKLVKNKYPDAIKVYSFFEKTFVDTYLVPEKGFKIANIKRRETDKVIAYDVVNKNGKIVGTYRLKYDVSSTGSTINEREIKTGKQAVLVDFFLDNESQRKIIKHKFIDSHGKTRIVNISDFVGPFEAKLSYSRFKDIWDFNRFIPNRQQSQKFDTLIEEEGRIQDQNLLKQETGKIQEPEDFSKKILEEESKTIVQETNDNIAKQETEINSKDQEGSLESEDLVTGNDINNDESETDGYELTENKEEDFPSYNDEVAKNSKINNVFKLRNAIESITGKKFNVSVIINDIAILSEKQFIERYNKLLKGNKANLRQIYIFNKNFRKRQNRFVVYFNKNTNRFFFLTGDFLDNTNWAPIDFYHTNKLDDIAKENGWDILYNSGNYVNVFKDSEDYRDKSRKLSEYRATKLDKDFLSKRNEIMWRHGQYVLVLRSAQGKSEVWVKNLFPDLKRKEAVRKTREKVLDTLGIKDRGVNVLKRSQIVMATGPIGEVSKKIGRKTRAIIHAETEFGFINPLTGKSEIFDNKDSAIKRMNEINKEAGTDVLLEESIRSGHDGAIYVTKKWLRNYLNSLGLKFEDKGGAKSFIWTKNKDGVFAGKGYFFVAQKGTFEYQQLKDNDIDMFSYEDASKLDMPHNKIFEINDEDIRFKLEEPEVKNVESFSRSTILLSPINIQEKYRNNMAKYISSFNEITLPFIRFKENALKKFFRPLIGFTESTESDNTSKLLDANPLLHPIILGLKGKDSVIKRFYLGQLRNNILKMPRKGFHSVARPSDSHLSEEDIMINSKIAKKKGIKVGDKLLLIRNPNIRANSVSIFTVKGFHNNGNSVMMNNYRYAEFMGGADFDGDTVSVIVPEDFEVDYFDSPEVKNSTGNITIGQYKKEKQDESVLNSDQLNNMIIRLSAGKDLIGGITNTNTIFHILWHNRVKFVIPEQTQGDFEVKILKSNEPVVLNNDEEVLVTPKFVDEENGFLKLHRIIAEYHLSATDNPKEDTLFSIAEKRTNTTIDNVPADLDAPIVSLVMELFDFEKKNGEMTEEEKRVYAFRLLDSKLFRVMNLLNSSFNRDTQKRLAWSYDRLMENIEKYVDFVKQNPNLGKTGFEKLLLNIWNNRFDFSFAEKANPKNLEHKAMLNAHKSAMETMKKFIIKQTGVKNPQNLERVIKARKKIISAFSSKKLSLKKAHQLAIDTLNSLSEKEQLALSWTLMDRTGYKNIAKTKIDGVSKRFLKLYFNFYNSALQKERESFANKSFNERTGTQLKTIPDFLQYFKRCR